MILPMSTPATRIAPGALVRTPTGEQGLVAQVNVTTGFADVSLPARRPDGTRRQIRRVTIALHLLQRA